MSISCMSRRWNAGDVTELEPVWEHYNYKITITVHNDCTQLGDSPLSANQYIPDEYPSRGMSVSGKEYISCHSGYPTIWYTFCYWRLGPEV